MIPKIAEDLEKDFEIEELFSKTYNIDLARNRMIGYIDELEAIRQAIYLILNIERYEHIIYSWNYGIELADLFGKPVPFILSELKNRITEALIQDDRIIEVDDFKFDLSVKGTVYVTFVAHTIYGDINVEKVVKI